MGIVSMVNFSTTGDDDMVGEFSLVVPHGFVN